MSRKTKYYIIAAVLLLLAVIAVICILSTSRPAQDNTEPPEPTQSAAPTLPPETEPPEETPEPTQTPEVKKHTMEIIAGEGGATYPCGNIEIENGEDISIVIEADEGYQIAKITFDGNNVRLLDSYGFTYDVPNVTQDHSFTVEFEPIEEPATTPEVTPEPTPEVTPEPTPEPTRPVSNTDI